MALVAACACARAFRVVVAVLIFNALVGLSQHVLVSERDDLEISQEAVGPAVGAEGIGSEIPGVYEDSVRSTGDLDVHPTVRSVALKHVAARGGETLEDSNQESFVYESEEEDDGSSWRLPEAADHRTIGKRMMIPRGRSLRTTKRPPFLCNLPSGTCQPSQTCCGSACVTVSSNPSHCGRCGHMCSAKRECCNGKCRRLATDEKNCGRCGSRCAPGVKCLFGLCGYSS